MSPNKHETEILERAAARRQKVEEHEAATKADREATARAVDEETARLKQLRLDRDAASTATPASKPKRRRPD